jgi:hypothetical protein
MQPDIFSEQGAAPPQNESFSRSENNLAFRRKSCYNTGIEAARKADWFPEIRHAIRLCPHSVRERSFK